MAAPNSPVGKSRIWYLPPSNNEFPEVVRDAFRKAWCRLSGKICRPAGFSPKSHCHHGNNFKPFSRNDLRKQNRFERRRNPRGVFLVTMPGELKFAAKSEYWEDLVIWETLSSRDGVSPRQ